MNTRRSLPILLACLLLLGGLTAAPAHAATHQVSVQDNEFRPATLQIDPGDTVVWTAMRPGHTVTAVDGSFDFHPHRTLNLGEQVEWTFEEEGEVRYFCRIHPGMAGVVRVGNPPPTSVPASPTLIVPDDVTTIAEAAAGAAAGTEILIRPGTYPEAVRIKTNGLTLRGLGEEPGDVVIHGSFSRDVGISVEGTNVRIENLRIQGNRDAGVRIAAASGAALTDVEVVQNDLYGVDAVGPKGVTLRRVFATNHAIAGVSVRDCTTCGARVDDSTLDGNAAGLLASGASGLVVRDSRIRNNAVGIVLRDAFGATVSANELADNDASNVRVASPFTAPPTASGAGVWINGGRGAHRIESNRLSGHTYNIAVTGPSAAVDTTLRSTARVEHNTVDGARHADLGWDGVGAGVCFGGNQRPDDAEPTSDPPGAQALYSCTAPLTVGIPFPAVTANLAAHAL